MALVRVYYRTGEPVSEPPRHGPALSGIAESARPDQFASTSASVVCRRRAIADASSPCRTRSTSASRRGADPPLRRGRTPRFDDWFKRATAQAPTRDSHPVSEVSHA
jgi:hypothetical protein